MRNQRKRVLLDFSVVAPGGSLAYATGFLGVLPDVWLAHADGGQLIVALPSGTLLSEEERLLRESGVLVHRLATGAPGSWPGRLLPHLALPWLAFRLRATDIFVPRDVAPLLIGGRLTILARNVLVWTRPTDASDCWALRCRRLAARLSLKRSSRVLVTTRAMGRLLPACPVRRRRVVFHGCDLPAIRLDQKAAVGAQSPLRVVGLGLIAPYKRFDVLIDTVRTLRDRQVAAELEIWGPVYDSVEADRLRELGSSRLGYDPLRGPLEPSARGDMFRSANLMMMGSSTESFGFPMVEAMRTSTIVVAPRGDLLEEICGDCAVTYDEGLSESAAEAIVAAQSQFSRLAASGLRRSQELFTWRRCVDSTIQAILDSDP